MVFLLDQRHNRGIPVEFFGRPAWTSRALALLAKRKEAPVFGAWAYREGLGRHMFRLEGPLPLGSEIEDNTQRFSEFMASRIRERPAHWLWLHDRWRVPKEANEPAGFSGSGVVWSVPSAEGLSLKRSLV